MTRGFGISRLGCYQGVLHSSKPQLVGSPKDQSFVYPFKRRKVSPVSLADYQQMQS